MATCNSGVRLRSCKRGQSSKPGEETFLEKVPTKNNYDRYEINSNFMKGGHVWTEVL